MTDIQPIFPVLFVMEVFSDSWMNEWRFVNDYKKGILSSKKVTIANDQSRLLCEETVIS